MPSLPIPDRPSTSAYLLLGTLCVVCLVVYLGGVHGGFQFDDIQTIVNNPALRAVGTPEQSWLALALSSGAGMLRRPLSMLSFGVNVAVFGMSPLAFKLVNLAIHLLNGALVYALGLRVAERLLRRDEPTPTIKPEHLALLAAGLWLLHPLNVSTVVYIAQRMNGLATLFTLAGLLCYADGRMRMLRGEPALTNAILGLCLFGVLAVFSKENGALIVAYALVIEVICFRFEAPTITQRRAIKGFFWLMVALPLALFAAYVLLHPHWLTAGYAGREFTLYERLLSEPRILCDYLLWIFVPNPAWMGLYHDDIATSTGWLQPFSTVCAIIFLLALMVAAWTLRRRSPAFAFGVAWFLVGHSMESTILPLELVFEHRNYLPMAGLLLGTVCAVAPWLASRLPARVAALAGIALVVGCASLTAVRATTWGNPLTLALTDARHHPDSSRFQYEAARAIINDGLMKKQRDQAEREAVPYLERSATLDHHSIHAITALILIQARRGPADNAALAELAARLRQLTFYPQANPFLDMLVTASQDKLSLTSADLSTLVDAALANPHFPPKVRAQIMNNYGAYQFNVARDNQSAITLTLAAAAEDPKNPYFELNLTKLALALGQPEMARQHLESARLLNTARSYDRDIAALAAQIH